MQEHIGIQKLLIVFVLKVVSLKKYVIFVIFLCLINNLVIDFQCVHVMRQLFKFSSFIFQSSKKIYSFNLFMQPIHQFTKEAGPYPLVPIYISKLNESGAYLNLSQS